MRDIFEEIFDGPLPDPMAAARRAMRPQLRKRFYRIAATQEGEGGFAVTLDGKPVRTPARRTLAAPNLALAQALAAEWNAQTEVIDPAVMPLVRLANAIIDAVADKPADVAAEIAKYLRSDLLFYRAEGPEGLVTRQAQAWDPVLTWAREQLDAHFVLARGVGYVEQPERAVAAARAAIPVEPWALGALASITTLTGSALLALALYRGVITVEEVWAAAHVDEDWNMETWGRDAVALERRAFHFREMQAAAKPLALSR